MENKLNVDLLEHQCIFMDAVFSGKYRFCAFMGGLGSGKTWIGAIIAYRIIMQFKCPMLIIAPTYSMLRDSTLENAKTVWDSFGAKYHVSFGGDKKFLFLNGIQIFLRSYKNFDAIRGIKTIGAVWGDEAAYGNIRGHNNAIGRVRKNILNKDWPQVFYQTSTPNGYNYLYDFYIREPKEDIEKQKDRYILHDVDSCENYFLDESYVRSLSVDLPSKYREQEKGGKFVLMVGNVWDPYISEPIFFRDSSNKIIFPGGIELGVDFGLRYPAVLFFTKAIDIKTGNTIDFCFDSILKERIRTDRLCEIIKFKLAGFNVDSPVGIYCDPAGDSEDSRGHLTDIGIMSAAFPKAQFYYSRSPHYRLVEKGIIAVEYMFENKLVAIDRRLDKTQTGDYTNVIEAINEAAYPEMKSGIVIKERYVKGNLSEHPCDAFRYWGVHKYLSLIANNQNR